MKPIIFDLDGMLINSAPLINAAAESFVRSIKQGCLDQMTLFGEASHRPMLSEFVEHYHKERNDQGRDNQILQLDFDRGDKRGTVACHRRLSGILNCFYRQVA